MFIVANVYLTFLGYILLFMNWNCNITIILLVTIWIYFTLLNSRTFLQCTIRLWYTVSYFRCHAAYVVGAFSEAGPPGNAMVAFGKPQLSHMYISLVWLPKTNELTESVSIEESLGAMAKQRFTICILFSQISFKIRKLIIRFRR